MYCGKCGRELDGENRFCVFCGAPVDGGENAAPSPEPPPREAGRGRVTAFLSSPGGIALIVGVTLVAIAGIVTGALLAARGDGRSEVVKPPGAVTDDEGEDSREAELDEALENMEDFLEVYVSEGWCGGERYMTSGCYEKFCGDHASAPPPDQIDGFVLDAEVYDWEFLDDETIIFSVLQRDMLEDGYEDEYMREFEMEKEDGSWLVSDCYKLE